MALELYNDDNFNILVVTTPPIRDISETFDLNRQATYNFNSMSGIITLGLKTTRYRFVFTSAVSSC